MHSVYVALILEDLLAGFLHPHYRWVVEPLTGGRGVVVLILIVGWGWWCLRLECMRCPYACCPARLHPVLPVPCLPASSQVAVSPDGTSAQARHDVNWGGVRANVGVAAGSGKYVGPCAACVGHPYTLHALTTTVCCLPQTPFFPSHQPKESPCLAHVLCDLLSVAVPLACVLLSPTVPACTCAHVDTSLPTFAHACCAGCCRFMFEVSVQDEGLCRVGWSTDKASLDLGTDKLVGRLPVTNPCPLTLPYCSCPLPHEAFLCASHGSLQMSLCARRVYLPPLHPTMKHVHTCD